MQVEIVGGNPGRGGRRVVERDRQFKINEAWEQDFLFICNSLNKKYKTVGTIGYSVNLY